MKIHMHLHQGISYHEQDKPGRVRSEFTTFHFILRHRHLAILAPSPPIDENVDTMQPRHPNLETPNGWQLPLTSIQWSFEVIEFGSTIDDWFVSFFRPFADYEICGKSNGEFVILIDGNPWWLFNSRYRIRNLTFLAKKWFYDQFFQSFIFPFALDAAHIHCRLPRSN